MDNTTKNLKRKIDELLSEKDFVVVAIDGKCTSGKTTLAAKLAEIYDCNVFHMDDFFLRPEQRTPARTFSGRSSSATAGRQCIFLSSI